MPQAPFVLDCFLQDLVMAIDRDRIEMLTCEFSTASAKPCWLPLKEDMEGKWRI